MALLLADFLYGADSENYSQYINENSPRIGILNLANEGNVSEVGGGLPTNPAYLATLPSMDERWISVDSFSHIFIWNYQDRTEVDYVGFAGHRNLIGRQCQINILLNSVVVKTIGPFMFTDLKPVFKLFDAVECDSAVVNFSSNESFDMSLGYISIGQSVALPRKIYVGHSPMPYARNVNTRFNISDNGTFLGQEVQSVQERSNVSVSNVPPEYYRDILYPNFQRLAEDRPFFWSWRPGDYPGEVSFCWLPQGSVNISNEKPNGFMQLSFDIVGHVNEF